MNMNKVLWLLIMRNFVNCNKEVLTKNIHLYEGSDFNEVVKATLFVDKTLLIKYVYANLQHGSGLLILAPRHFGKSTNMNMLKRFFQTNVNESGHYVRNEETINYNIFRNNYLNIYRLNDFFIEHFGKYPVISIDYEPLSQVKSIEEMLATFTRKIMMNTFQEHKYLLHDDFLWEQNDTFSWIRKQQFEYYLNTELNYKLTEGDIQTGFSFLARLLHKRFQERVIVLIDNYDSFVESSLFGENHNIFHLISAVNCDLLRSESVERSVVTGVRRTSGPTVDRGQILPSNVEDSTADHKVWPYYGLSSIELDTLLQPYIVDDDERHRAIGKIVHSYSGYSVATFEMEENESCQLLDSQTCSVWSVMKYMEKELDVENISSLV